MFNTLLFIHFVIALLIIVAILIHKPDSDEIGGISSSGMNAGKMTVVSSKSPMNKIIGTLSVLFFINVLLMGNISSSKEDVSKKIEQTNKKNNKSQIPIAK